MDLEIGSDLFQNTDGTIEVEGLPQIEIVLKNPTGPLLVTLVVPDQDGRVIAKVMDSTLAFNESGMYALSRTPTSLKMTQTQSEKVVLQVDLKDPDRVAIRQAELTTLKGHVLEVTPVEWRIGDKKSRGGESDQKGGPAVIG